MNSSQHLILLLVALLFCFIVNNYYSSENFMIYTYPDSTYAPIGVYGINNPYVPTPLNQYANQVAYDLQNPFPTSITGTSLNSRAVWDPASYREVQEPDGQFVGIISPN